MALKNKIKQYVVNKTPFPCKDTQRLKVEGWGKLSHKNINQRRPGAAKKI